MRSEGRLGCSHPSGWFESPGRCNGPDTPRDPSACHLAWRWNIDAGQVSRHAGDLADLQSFRPVCSSRSRVLTGDRLPRHPSDWAWAQDFSSSVSCSCSDEMSRLVKLKGPRCEFRGRGQPTHAGRMSEPYRVRSGSRRRGFCRASLGVRSFGLARSIGVGTGRPSCVVCVTRAATLAMNLRRCIGSVRRPSASA